MIWIWMACVAAISIVLAVVFDTFGPRNRILCLILEVGTFWVLIFALGGALQMLR